MKLYLMSYWIFNNKHIIEMERYDEMRITMKEKAQNDVG